MWSITGEVEKIMETLDNLILRSISVKYYMYVQPDVDCISFTNPHTPCLLNTTGFVLIFYSVPKQNLACALLTKEACANYRCPEANIEVFNAIHTTVALKLAGASLIVSFL
jgi:hypothetical protein